MCAGQFGRVFYAVLVRPGNKMEEDVAVKTMKCTYVENNCTSWKNTIVSCQV